MTRDEQAAALVTEALTQGRIVKSFGPDGDYTVGPYHTATGPEAFALFGYGSEVPRPTSSARERPSTSRGRSWLAWAPDAPERRPGPLVRRFDATRRS